MTLLSVLSAGLADALESLRRGVLVGFAAEVAETDDSAQPFLLVDHRQAANLGLAHPIGDVLDIIVEPSANDVIGHQFAHRSVRSVALRDTANRNIAIGDHAEKAIALGHRNRTSIGAEHEVRRFPG